MTPFQLQGELAKLGFYNGLLDGDFGPRSKAALIAALAAGPDTTLTTEGIVAAAVMLDADPVAIRAVWAVEAAGAGFEAGSPKILPEPHRFSKLTGGRYDAARPDLSWAVWKPGCYPKTQAERYAQLAEMVALDVDAGLSACSYGAFQILGQNFRACGYDSPWAMAYDLSLTEGRQLRAFITFVSSSPAMAAALKAQDWDRFAALYNGPAYRQNGYALKLAQATGRALTA